MESTSTTQRFPWRTALAIWASATIGAACVIPYANALTPALRDSARRLGISVALVALLSVLQSAVMLAVFTFVGLWAAEKLGMGAPVFDARLGGRAFPPDLRRSVRVSAGAGIVSGCILLALDLWVFLPHGPRALGNLLHGPQPPAWTGLLASFEGGVTEEVELRLFLLSVLALGLRSVGRWANRGSEVLPTWAFWSANLVAAVLFGLGHLPMTARLMPLTAVIVIRAIVLNGIVGLVAGYLFFRRGIEMAMVCHFSADIVLHVLAPIAQPLLLRAHF